MCSEEDDPSMHDIPIVEGECSICGEEPDFQHCPECHLAAKENREPHQDWGKRNVYPGATFDN
jgi:hypothetical protein